MEEGEYMCTVFIHACIILLGTCINTMLIEVSAIIFDIQDLSHCVDVLDRQLQLLFLSANRGLYTRHNHNKQQRKGDISNQY